MKKTLTALLSCALVASLTACGGSGSASTTAAGDTKTETTASGGNGSYTLKVNTALSETDPLFVALRDVFKKNVEEKTNGDVQVEVCLLYTSKKASDYGNGENGYLKSATYYSDEWVINFWNSESSHMEEELKQIAEDGFNSIILVVPWREFQPSMNPQRYNDYAWEKFDRVMEAAQRQNLKVMLRVGYTWDYYSGDNVLDVYKRQA